VLDSLEIERLALDTLIKGATVVDESGAVYGVLSTSVDAMSTALLPWISRPDKDNKKSELENKAIMWDNIFGKNK
jgi:hypothetical protein